MERQLESGEGSQGVLSIREVPPGSRRLAAFGCRTRNVGVLVASAIAAWACALAFASAPALAETGHAYLSQVTGAPLTAVEGLAVGPEGNVFAADSLAGVVDVYSAGKLKTQIGTGVLEGEMPGVAVDGSGRVYVADAGTNTVDVFKPSGKEYELLSVWTGAAVPSGFVELAGVAVDNSGGKSAGHVYVLDKGENGTEESVVDVFKPQPEAKQEPELLTTIKGKPKLEEPSAIAVSSSTGAVYIADANKAVVEQFSAEGVFQKVFHVTETPYKLAFVGISGIAVEAGTGDLYVTDVENKVVDEFNEAGKWVGWLTGRERATPPAAEPAPFGELHSVALAPSGEVVVADGESPNVEAPALDVFAAGTVVPDATTKAPAAKIERTTVTLKGKINAIETQAKSPATYYFEYGEAGSGVRLKTAEVTEKGEAEVEVSAAITGLKAETPYEFRLVAKNANGYSYGLTVPFTTANAVSELSTGPAAEVEPESAKLTGSLHGPVGTPKKINPGAKYFFEYGTTTAYGTNTPEVTAGGVETVAAEAKVTGLQPNTTYHYRIVGTDSFGTTLGSDVAFKTAGPPTIVDQPTTPITHTEATVNAQINPGERATEYFVEYGESTGYGEQTAPVLLKATGETAEAVAVVLSKLKLATTYHFRVVAKNSAGTVKGADQQFKTILIESTSATNVTGESAVLQAQINPLGEQAAFRFEYGETEAYGTSVPVPEGNAGNGTGDATVSAQVLGLKSATTYHYRVVATLEKLGAGVGPDHTFTTLSSGVAFTLPDARAFELVSPPHKQGGYIEPQSREGGAIQASQDGNALAYIVNGPIVESPEGNRSPEAQQVISTRGPGAWSSQEIVTPHERPWGLRPGVPKEYEYFSLDLSVSFVQPFPFALTPLAEPPLAPPLSETERGHQEKTMYLRNDAPIVPGAAEEQIYNEAKLNGETLAKEHGEAAAKPGYLPLITAANVPPGTEFGGRPLTSLSVKPYVAFQDASPDLTHVVLRTEESPPLVSGTVAKNCELRPCLYEWAAGELQLISVLPAGTGAPEPELGYGYKAVTQNHRHSISSDGSRVFWTNDETANAGLGRLYVRQTTRHETLQLDEPEKGLPTFEKGAALFQIASADGSKVFFSDTQKLTAGSTATPLKADLYECELVEVAEKLKCNLNDLTIDPHAGESADVKGAVLGASEDGSYVYLVASGVLASGAESGANNLYVLHYDGTKWTTALVGVLSSEDAPDWLTRGRIALVAQTARVSPNGHFLAFMSNRSLTGYDNTDVNEETGRHADEEVFLFDAVGAHLTCASCNPTGARPTGVFDQQPAGEGLGLVVDRPETWTSFENPGVAHWLAGSIPGWTAIDETKPFYQSRYLSDSGRLFFNSADPLVAALAAPKALGGTRSETIGGKVVAVGNEHVYQYELPGGNSSCTAAQGCVSLISSGISEKESAFLDASETGNDVFFLTASPLVPQDTDSSYDVYDARVCTEASPCQTPPPAPPTPCHTVEECRQVGPTPPPSFEPPPSSTFSGPGSPIQPTPKTGTLPSKTTKPPPPTRAQKLAKALAICHKLRHRTRAQKSKRSKCESQAKKKYGAKKAAKANHSRRRAK
jgi:hypothetical protein